MPDEKPQCKEALAQIYTYLDGELTPDARVVIGRHLEECPPCGDLFGFQADLKKLIAQRCVDQPPEGLRQRIADALGLPGAGPGMQLPGPPKL
jgi:mycothiol system anti-sigma-R factor